MKKITAIILSLICFASLTACAPQTAALGVDAVLPWSTDQTPADAYERTEYTLTKHDEASGADIASGSLTIEVSGAPEITGDTSYSKITINSSMTYNDDAPEADRGKTDSVSSVCVFVPESLMPIRSEKTVTIEPRGESNVSYRIENDYREKKSVLTKSGAEPHELTFADESLVEVYDNEMLFYAVRALNQIKAGGANSFKLANFYDMHGANKYATATMYFSCTEEGNETTMFFNGEGGLPDFRNGLLDAEGSLTAINAAVTLGQGGSQRGTPIDLTFSMTPFNVGEDLQTKKALLRIKTYEYDLATSEIRYTTTYTISSYTTTPEA